MMNNPIYHLLQKFDVPTPRYTSYPTVPAWTSKVSPQDYENSLQSLQLEEPLSLYFHLPFCESLCHFCGCMQVITKDHSRSREYVDLLLQEVDLVTSFLPQASRGISQLHFGGGTPNFLQPEELTRILEKIGQHFHFLPDAEMAIEMHPRTSTQVFCKNLKKLGFNRISLGVQDFDPIVQKLINRNQTYEMTEQMISLLRDLGFTSFNFDLIYGLPGQSMDGWSQTLEKVIKLRPNRLAVYSYAHVPWVRPVQRSFKDSDIPTPEMKLQFFEKAYSTFTQNGYRHIGIDHFALHDDELSRALDQQTIHRNFMGYSTKADAHQIGFGMSSISYAAGNYFQNHKDLKNYYQAVRNGKLATFRGFILNRDDAIRRDLITQIMCQGRCLISEFEKKWKISFEDYFSSELQALKSFLDDSLLQITNEELVVINEGTLFLRNISAVFDLYLAKIKQHSTNPTFSKAV